MIAMHLADSLPFCFSKRPYAEECHEHRWLISSDYMIKKRERAVFLGNRLKVMLTIQQSSCFINTIDVS